MLHQDDQDLEEMLGTLIEDFDSINDMKPEERNDESITEYRIKVLSKLIFLFKNLLNKNVFARNKKIMGISSEELKKILEKINAEKVIEDYEENAYEYKLIYAELSGYNDDKYFLDQCIKLLLKSLFEL